jgi:hypothetical protein
MEVFGGHAVFPLQKPLDSDVGLAAGHGGGGGRW